MEEETKPQGRINPDADRLVNPAKYFIKWGGKTGVFSYYDKATQSDIELPMPLTFIPVYKCATVKGYHQKKKTSYWANEVKDVSKEQFVIKSKATGPNAKIETELVGFHKDIKEHYEARNIKWVESLYVGIKNDKGVLELANIQITKASLGSWLEFVKKNDPFKCAVKVTGFKEEEEGAVEYKSPVYTAIKISEKTDAEAAVLQKQIMDYLKVYFAKNASATPEQPKAATEASKQPETTSASTTTTGGGRKTETIEEAEIILPNLDESEEPPF